MYRPMSVEGLLSDPSVIRSYLPGESSGEKGQARRKMDITTPAVSDLLLFLFMDWDVY